MLKGRWRFFKVFKKLFIPKILMELQVALHSQNNPERKKNKIRGLIFPDFKIYYKAIIMI